MLMGRPEKVNQKLKKMGLLCSCPAGAELTDLTLSSCPVDIGQIQKILFQRQYSSGTTLNSFTIASADPALLASWSAKTAASDGTKVVVSPTIGNPETEAGEAITFGGGNATVGGIELIVGRGPTTFSAVFYRTSPLTIAQMKDYMCEDLAVYLVDEYGRIIGLADSLSSPTIFYPIPVEGFFVGDRSLGGLEEPDTNVLSFSFLPNWSDLLYIVTPTDFNPLTGL